ncbi:MAG: putative Ig domain-containing protein, partial [Blastocatellia bacterium]
MKTFWAVLVVVFLDMSFGLVSTTSAQGTLYEVGPGKPYTSIGAVPWESLQPGDTVLIYYRAAPYKEKWVICRQGASSAPITIRGVAGPNGELPILDGNGATTRSSLNYWNQERGVIKIGGANNPPDTMPRYITVENLDIRSARPPFTFTAANGSTQAYINNASTIYIEKGENITVRNCILHDCGNGFFVASSDELASRNIMVEGNYIYDNGNANSIFEHNNYTAAIGITFQYNHFGPLRTGCLGNNLKDRSAGLVVRYNWIEGGNRQLDLVDGEDSSLVRNDPGYSKTFVYGNVLIEPAAAGNRQITHYGGDSGATADYRKGTLYFYNNTIVSTRTDRTTLLRLSTNEESCDFRNNISYVTAGGSTLSLLDDTGVLSLSHNWFKPGFVNSFSTMTGTVSNDNTSVLGSSPGFADEAGQDFKLAAGSGCLNAGTFLSSNAFPANDVTREYVKHQSGQQRVADGVLDIGAYERPSYAALLLMRSHLPGGEVSILYSTKLPSTGGLRPYTWSIISGSLPPAVTLNSVTGVISGTPTSAGTYDFSAQVSDGQSPPDTDVKDLSIVVTPAPSP